MNMPPLRPGRPGSRSALVAGLALAGLGATFAIQEAARTVVKTGTFEENLYLAGGEVEVRAEVVGDVIVAGGRIVIDGRVDGDVMAAGGQVTVAGDLLDDVRAAGGQIDLSGTIEGEAVVAGGQITLRRGASVAERAWIAAGAIDIDGEVGGELRASGGMVRIGGRVDGDAHVTAERLEVLSTARIAGDLIYESPEPAVIASGAEIGGSVSHTPAEPRGAFPTGIVRAILLVGLALIGVMLLLLFPRFAVAAAAAIGRDPLKALGLGLAALILVPVTAVLLGITILGLVPALLLGLLYLLVLVLGYLTGALYLGELALSRLRAPAARTVGWRVAALVAALIALALVRGIPILGGLIGLAVLIFGIGAIALALYRAYSARGEADATA